MIVMLYESDYPKVSDGTTPNWKHLPVGFIAVPRVTQPPKSFEGEFIFCRDPKPRIGEHLLAVFAIDNTCYLYNATLNYSGSENDIAATDTWRATLALHDMIDRWSA